MARNGYFMARGYSFEHLKLTESKCFRGAKATAGKQLGDILALVRETQSGVSREELGEVYPARFGAKISTRTFVWAYERSCAQYRVVRDSLGVPDPLRLRYRSELAQAVAETVRAGAAPPTSDAQRMGNGARDCGK